MNKQIDPKDKETADKENTGTAPAETNDGTGETAAKEAEDKTEEAKKDEEEGD